MKQGKQKMGKPESPACRKRLKIPYIGAISMVAVQFFTLPVFAANGASPDIWDKAQEIMQDVYGKIVGISTIAGVVAAAVALLLMNFSKNGRTVDESRAWLKRIIICWAILNGLGFIMAYLVPLLDGGQWNA